MRRVRKWLALPATRRTLTWRALAVVVSVRLLILLPFGMWRRALRGAHLLAHRIACRDASRDDVAWAVSRVSDVVPGATCLTRALATALMLPHADPAAVLHFGVQRAAGGGVEGHAWLESLDGVLIGDENLERYARLGSWRIAPKLDATKHRPPRAARG